MDPTHSVLFTLGALLLVVMRRTPAHVHAAIRTALVGLGTFEAVYALQQKWLNYDLLWGPLFGATLVPHVQPLGTLGTVDALGAYAAMVAPLMPWYLLPLAVCAVWTTKSLGALAALTVGLTLRYRHALSAPLIAAAGTGVTAYVVLTKNLEGVVNRLIVQDFAFTHAWSDPVIGAGLGGWARAVPSAQVAHKWAPTGELWREAHSEPMQWVFEAGIVGAVLLAGWLWYHRAMFLHPTWGGSIAAVAVSSLTFFTLHVVSTALFAIIVIGLGTAHADEALAGGG